VPLEQMTQIAIRQELQAALKGYDLVRLNAALESGTADPRISRNCVFFLLRLHSTFPLLAAAPLLTPSELTAARNSVARLQGIAQARAALDAAFADQHLEYAFLFEHV
jgi:hypothetical protein